MNFHGLPHSDLNAARLPIPPRPHVTKGAGRNRQAAFSKSLPAKQGYPTRFRSPSASPIVRTGQIAYRPTPTPNRSPQGGGLAAFPLGVTRRCLCSVWSRSVSTPSPLWGGVRGGGIEDIAEMVVSICDGPASQGAKSKARNAPTGRFSHRLPILSERKILMQRSQIATSFLPSPGHGASRVAGRAGTDALRASARLHGSRVRRNPRGTASELVWLVEHPPLYTAGTSAQARTCRRRPLSRVQRRSRRRIHLSRARPARSLCHARPEAPARGCARLRRRARGMDHRIAGRFQRARRTPRGSRRRLGRPAGSPAATNGRRRKTKSRRSASVCAVG